MKKIVGVFQKRGFQDTDLGELKELIDTTRESTEDSLMEMSASEPGPVEDERVNSSARETDRQ